MNHGKARNRGFTERARIATADVTSYSTDFQEFTLQKKDIFVFRQAGSEMFFAPPGRF